MARKAKKREQNWANDLIAYMLIIMIALSLTSFYVVFHKASKAAKAQEIAAKEITAKEITARVSEGIVTAYVLPSVAVEAPTIFIKLNRDNISSDLNWTQVVGADHYVVYFSSNISAMIGLDPYSPPSYVSSVNVYDLNWTDSAARDSLIRYYRVAAYKGASQNLSYDTVGTCYLPLVAGNNMISLCMNYTYTAESFMQRIPFSLYRPAVVKLDRPNESTEVWVSKTLGFGRNYNLSEGKGYLLTLDSTMNYTIVGYAFTSPFTLYLIAGNNQIGIDGIRSFTAESFLRNISYVSYRPAIVKLERPNESTEIWVSKTRGFGRDYNLSIGKGYLATLDNNFNYSLG